VTVGLPADRLFRRLSDAKAILEPVLAQPERFEITRFPQVSNFTIGAVPRGYAVQTIMDPSSLRLRTRWEDIYFNYHEIWRLGGKPQMYIMDRAYLHFYLRNVEGLDELQALSLHCDPALDKNDAHYRYRRGPHFHIGGATPNIDRAHVSLCVSDAALGGNNLGALTRTLRDSLGMAIHEVIPQYIS
jgi:hypothetical protein